MTIILYPLVTFTIINVVSSSILFIPSTQDKTPSYIMSHLANELAKRSHEIEWINIGNSFDVFLESSIKKKHITVDSPRISPNSIDDVYNNGYLSDNGETNHWLTSIDQCDKLLTDKKLKKELLSIANSSQIDLLIIDDLYNPCGLLIAHLSNKPFIYWSMTSMRTETAWSNHSPSPPSYVPVPGTGLSDEMSFFEKVYNFASYFKRLYIHHNIIQANIDGVYKKHFPSFSISSFDIEREASLNFINNPPIFDFARSYMPRVNYVGGLHCRKANSLKGDIEKFARKGNFIVISGGFDSKLSSDSSIKVLLEAIHGTEYRFIWQLDVKKYGQNLPSNVYAEEWLPLQDLLGHKNCQAHITSGGLNSIIESVYHGVPIIGLPFTTIEFDNILRVSARDSGVLVDPIDFNAQTIRDVIKKVYGNMKLKEEMQIFQDMVQDVPYSELHHASYWVEFIKKHQEVPHARSGADHLNILQYFLIDVILFMSFVAITILSCVYYSIYYVFKFAFYIGYYFVGGIVKSKKVKVN